MGKEPVPEIKQDSIFDVPLKKPAEKLPGPGPQAGAAPAPGAAGSEAATDTAKAPGAAGSPSLLPAVKTGPVNIEEIQADTDTETMMLDIVRRRQSNKKELISIALTQTNENDWVLQGGQPYLEITGAEKIAPIFSVRIVNTKYEKETGVLSDGKPYVRHWYYGDGEIAPNGIVLYRLEGLFGSAWTRDDFFAKNKDNSYKSIDDIDERDLRYKAYSDLMRVAVVRLIGLRSVTIEELKTAKLKVENIKGIQRGVEVLPEDAKKQEEFLQIAKRIVGTDATKLKAFTKKMTIWVNKEKQEIFKENITECVGKSLEISLDKARREAENFDRQNGG